MNWIRLMPAIPLAPGVPVIRPDGTKAIALRPHRNRGPREEGIWTTWADSDRHPCIQQTGYNWRNLTVDLDDPQGFGFVWRKLEGTLLRALPGKRYRVFDAAGIGIGQATAIRARHMREETTNEDRVLLARAIAELNN